MARRAPSAYKKYEHRARNRFSVFIVMFALLILILAANIRGSKLKAQEAEYIAQEQQLQEKIDAELARSEELEEYAKYTQTQKFVEDVAKEKLGLVYEDEIVFKTEK